MFHYILFDLDGTLTDSKEGILKSVQHALRFYGIEEPDLSKLMGFVGPPLKQSFMDFYGFDEAKTEKAIVKYRERFSVTGLFENRVYDGIYEMLTKLKKAGKVLAVATSKPEVFTKRILDHFKLTDYFDVIVGSGLDDTRGTKAEVICEVLNQLQLYEDDLQKAVMVGDRKQDVIGAKACHLPCIGAAYGYAEAGELEAAGADYIVPSVAALQNFLLEH